MTPRQVVEHFDGNVTRAARHIGIKAPSLQGWLKRGEVPALRQAQLYLMTEGRLEISPEAKKSMGL